MEIVKGWKHGCYINFQIGTLKNGIRTDVEGISIYDDDFEWIGPIVGKYYPSFDIYETVNPINRSILERISYDIYKISLWLKNNEEDTDIQYYIEWVNKWKDIQSYPDVIPFFDELSDYIEHLLNNYEFDFLNLEGF